LGFIQLSVSASLRVLAANEAAVHLHEHEIGRFVQS